MNHYFIDGRILIFAFLGSLQLRWRATGEIGEDYQGGSPDNSMLMEMTPLPPSTRLKPNSI